MKCQLCEGKIVDGRCNWCGMPFHEEPRLYHLNEDRSDHYRHANPKMRSLMREQETPLADRVNRPDAAALSRDTGGSKKNSMFTGGHSAGKSDRAFSNARADGMGGTVLSGSERDGMSVAETIKARNANGGRPGTQRAAANKKNSLWSGLFVIVVTLLYALISSYF